MWSSLCILIIPKIYYFIFWELHIFFKYKLSFSSQGTSSIITMNPPLTFVYLNAVKSFYQLHDFILIHTLFPGKVESKVCGILQSGSVMDILSLLFFTFS